MSARTVSIVYRTTPHYRIPLYEDMRVRLHERGVRLRVLSGMPSEDEALREDVEYLSWGEQVERRRLPIPGRGLHLEWQGALRTTRNDDAVILEDATRLVSNWAQLLRRSVPGGPRVALWGHGSDLQNPDGIAKGGVRRWTQRSADHYFAYTESTAEKLEESGFPRARITVLNNTIDTSQLQQNLKRVTKEDLEEFGNSLDLPSEARIGLFLGGLYEEKRLPFLLEAADSIHREDSQFRLLVIGSGPERDLIGAASESRDWLHYLGPMFGMKKAVALRASQLLLMPGLVGLVAVDALLAGTPIVTTADGRHSPEIDYIQDRETGFILTKGCTPSDYGRVVVDLMQRRIEEREAVAMRGLLRGEQLTIEAMSQNFCVGVDELLTQVRA